MIRYGLLAFVLLAVGCKQPVKDCCSGEPKARVDTMPQHWLDFGFAHNRIP